MKWLGFLIFIFLTVAYIWDGKDFYNKRQWLYFGLKLLSVYLVTFLLVLIFKGVQAIWHDMPVHTVKTILLLISSSFLCLFGMKFLVIMLCTMFSRIMAFHEKFNPDNYQKLSSLSGSFSSPLLFLAKCVISCGSVLIFYGVWLA